ncbi:hypothetical protein PAPYR_13040 [Paratrimastix pyriformis]|uniref:Uncharacterized protein n=1 Tax=Paratrimastix pyriformis TaxID=342808 RepID=A0ABQ8U2H3_9EUKA|nr:hypothetical protein PAPYR_13040 [Paratrimastix pyriformis]
MRWPRLRLATVTEDEAEQEETQRASQEHEAIEQEQEETQHASQDADHPVVFIPSAEHSSSSEHARASVLPEPPTAEHEQTAEPEETPEPEPTTEPVPEQTTIEPLETTTTEPEVTTSDPVQATTTEPAEPSEPEPAQSELQQTGTEPEAAETPPPPASVPNRSPCRVLRLTCSPGHRHEHYRHASSSGPGQAVPPRTPRAAPVTATSTTAKPPAVAPDRASVRSQNARTATSSTSSRPAAVLPQLRVLRLCRRRTPPPPLNRIYSHFTNGSFQAAGKLVPEHKPSESRSHRPCSFFETMAEYRLSGAICVEMHKTQMEPSVSRSPTLALLPVGKLLSANSVAVEKPTFLLASLLGEAGASGARRPASRTCGCFRHGGFLPGGSCPGGGGRHAIGSGSGGSSCLRLLCSRLRRAWRLLPAAGVASGAAAPLSLALRPIRGSGLGLRARLRRLAGLGLLWRPHSPALGLALDGPRLALFARGLASLLEEGSTFRGFLRPPCPRPGLWPHSAAGTPSADSSDESLRPLRFPLWNSLGVYPAPNALTLAAYLARNPQPFERGPCPPPRREPGCAAFPFRGGPQLCRPRALRFRRPLLAGAPLVATATCTPVPSGCASACPRPNSGRVVPFPRPPLVGACCLRARRLRWLLFRLMEERSPKDYLRRWVLKTGVADPFVPHFLAAADLAEFGATVNLSTVPPDVVAGAGAAGGSDPRPPILVAWREGLEFRLGLKGLEAALPGRWLRRWDPTCSRLRNCGRSAAERVVAAQINAEASTETNKLRKIWPPAFGPSTRTSRQSKPSCRTRAAFWAPRWWPLSWTVKGHCRGGQGGEESPAVAKGLSAPSGPAIVSRSARARSPVRRPQSRPAAPPRPPARTSTGGP